MKTGAASSGFQVVITCGSMDFSQYIPFPLAHPLWPFIF